MPLRFCIGISLVLGVGNGINSPTGHDVGIILILGAETIGNMGQLELPMQYPLFCIFFLSFLGK